MSNVESQLNISRSLWTQCELVTRDQQGRGNRAWKQRHRSGLSQLGDLGLPRTDSVHVLITWPPDRALFCVWPQQ